MMPIESEKYRLPKWFKQEIPGSSILNKFRSFKKQGVNTVCFEARCPNWLECLSVNSMTFMILGDRCTRNCQFCAVGKCDKLNQPSALDRDEPYRIINVISELRLNYICITSVNRDDLDDAGAGHFVKTIKLIRNYQKNIKIELLIPDFTSGRLEMIINAGPDVLAHNVETVPRLYPQLRDQASYSRSLQVLAESKQLNNSLITKSSILLGMTETKKEVVQVMEDLIKVNCDVVVLGQYLSPTLKHYPVAEYISREQFEKYKEIALDIGFKAVISAPLARTSYKAKEVYHSLRAKFSDKNLD